MKALIQRVSSATVDVSGQTIASIGAGLLIFLGVAQGDTEGDGTYLARKIVGLRIFEDPPGKMQHSVQEIKGQILAVPQFTLLANVQHGRRPDFSQAAPPEVGKKLFGACCQALRSLQVEVQEGQFGEHMRVLLENNGPVTIALDSRE
jgi:D-aminoacyl-tRNA deacylase